MTQFLLHQGNKLNYANNKQNLGPIIVYEWVKVRNTCTQVDQITLHDGQTRYKNVNMQCHIRIVLFAMCVSCIDLLVIPEKYSLTNVYIITVQKDLNTNTHFPHFQYRKAGMMTWLNGNIFHVTGPLWGESPGHPLDCPHKGQWLGALMFSLIGAWTNGSANSRDACDLRRHRTNYDVTVMFKKNVINEILYIGQCSFMSLQFLQTEKLKYFAGQVDSLFDWHDDAIKWKHFPRYWPFVREIHRSPVNSPHKGQWRRALIFLWSAPN